MGQTAQSLTCSIMEKPHTGLDECPIILLSCFGARNSDEGGSKRQLQCLPLSDGVDRHEDSFGDAVQDRGALADAPVARRFGSRHFKVGAGWALLEVIQCPYNEAKSVAGNHWLRSSASVALLRGQVWSSLGIRCQQQQLVD